MIIPRLCNRALYTFFKQKLCLFTSLFHTSLIIIILSIHECYTYLDPMNFELSPYIQISTRLGLFKLTHNCFNSGLLMTEHTVCIMVYHHHRILGALLLYISINHYSSFFHRLHMDFIIVSSH